MKKHQKFLVGLMILGLAGGVGTAFALKYGNDATKTDNGKGADSAIYLEWSDGTNTTSTAKMENFEANVAQYRPVVVSPRSSKTVAGIVEVTFALALGENNELPGFTVEVYDFGSTYKAVPATGDSTDNKLEIGANSASCSLTFAVAAINASSTDNSHRTTNNYLLGFKWDGSPVANSSNEFGGTLTISASFTAGA